jgi:ABC-type Mn2+/Zn2+ transport system ATPase subunit
VFDELSSLSVGQKCTALLIIALVEGDHPVIIDQPEDALDVVSVWEDIAKKLIGRKNFKQFILTTHNSSVAVAADSDQYIILQSNAIEGQISIKGAIDRKEVKDSVISHLEGGPEPYNLKRKKYNQDID